MSANIPANSSPPVPESPPDNPASVRAWRAIVARTVNLLQRGKINAATTLTLTASVTSTVLTDDRIGPKSAVVLEAQTASAATARLTAPGIYVVPTSGSATVHHPSNAAVDQTFAVLIVG
ncbi:MAG TPA: hypothetical protein VF113_04735 [Stellaceae bacterium]